MKTASATAGWICGRCRRRVPHYVAVCRCGLARFGEQLTGETIEEPRASDGSSPGKAVSLATRAARYLHIT
jgi:hypothetical protein